MNLTFGFSASLDGPDWLKAIRARAAKDIESMPLPTTEQELWRYSRVNEIAIDALAPAVPDHGVSAWSRSQALSNTGNYVVLVNGALAEVRVSNGVTVRGAADFDVEQPLETDLDEFARLNTAFSPEPIFIDIKSGTVVDSPIVVVNHVEGSGVAVFPRLVVRAGDASQSTVVEHVSSGDGGGLVASVTEVSVGQSAIVNFVSVQDLSGSFKCVAAQRSRVERDATYSSTAISLGGDYARIRTDTKLVGAGSTSKLRAVYVGDGTQMHVFRTLQDHIAPKTTSDLLFKGVVGDEARSVYSGLIRVQKGAAGTNAFQTNRNLVISDKAHADSVPNLEIEDNDVRCSHASAVGPVDEEQRYYLQSRGVPAEVADQLIINGFLHEVIESLEPVELREFVNGHVMAKLDQVAARMVGA